MKSNKSCRHIISYLALILAFQLFTVFSVRAVDSFDIISGVIDSPRFKGKSPLEKLVLVAELCRTSTLDQSDLSFLVLDWADKYIREPTNRLKRLEYWSRLVNNDKLRNVRIPRDFLNRLVLAEYLVNQNSYQTASPKKKLEIIRNLEKQNLVDWSVALAYSRIYAGTVILAAEGIQQRSPIECLRTLERMTSQKLIGWHYRVPTEAVLVAEALAMDAEFEKGIPLQRLMKLREMEANNLLSPVNRKELEKLPVWRLLINDLKFLKSAPQEKRQRIHYLKSNRLITQSTQADLLSIFRLNSLTTSKSEIKSPSPKFPSSQK